MEAAQTAATATDTAQKASAAAAETLSGLKEAVEQATAQVLGALDTLTQTAATAGTTTETAQSATVAAGNTCDTAVEAAEHLGATDPITKTKQAQYEIQTATAFIASAVSAIQTLQGMITELTNEFTAPLVSAASAVETESMGPMQTAANTLENAKVQLESLL